MGRSDTGRSPQISDARSRTRGLRPGESRPPVRTERSFAGTRAPIVSVQTMFWNKTRAPTGTDRHRKSAYPATKHPVKPHSVPTPALGRAVVVPPDQARTLPRAPSPADPSTTESVGGQAAGH